MSEWFTDPWGHHDPNRPEYLLTDSGQLVSPGQSTGGFGHVGSTGAPNGPASTLVGAAGGFQIDLQWDSSVRAASNWSAVESAVVQAAQIYTGLFANREVVNIQVGLGEIDGSHLDSGDLGESESLGFVEGYGAVTRDLATADAALVKAGLVSSSAFTADTALSGASFFVPSAEAKALGMAKATSSSIDGYIGLSATSLFYPATGGHISAGQYDAVGVAAHELSEVMGRVGMLGESLSRSASHVYSPLDLFRWTSAGHPDTTQTAGYFSTTAGQSMLASYNNPSNGGDASDWASGNRTDSYNAFSSSGVMDQVTRTDLLEDAVLGYQLAPGKTLSTLNA